MLMEGASGRADTVPASGLIEAPVVDVVPGGWFVACWRAGSRAASVVELVCDTAAGDVGDERGDDDDADGDDGGSTSGIDGT